MNDPRKPVRTPPAEQGREMLNLVHEHLLAATEVGAKAIGATGATFVIVGVGVWASELTELDARATAKYFRALADIFDPKTNPSQKARADKDRSQAVRSLYAALDLVMAEAKGHG
jgi:hypothetical protein